MGTDQLEAMTNDQIQAMIVALQGVIAPIQEKLTAMQKVLEEREQEKHEWDKFLSHPESQKFLKKLTEQTNVDIAAGRTEEWSACREDLLNT